MGLVNYGDKGCVVVVVVVVVVVKREDSPYFLFLKRTKEVTLGKGKGEGRNEMR
jgi:hypothetical protein